MRKNRNASSPSDQRPGTRDVMAAAVAKLPEMTRADMAVLRVLELHTDQEQKAWPSQSRIAELTGLVVRSVRRALAHLRELGLLAIVAAATPRAPAVVKVAPAAVRGGFVQVLSRADTAVRSERTPVRTEQKKEQIPPNPPEGAGASHSSDRKPKADTLMEIATRAGEVRNVFQFRMAVQAFANAGGTEAELRSLLAELQHQQGGVGLLCAWLRNGWRDVLEDRELSFREGVARKRAPSSSGPLSAQVILSTVMDRAAR